jgi:hypothetical protein
MPPAEFIGIAEEIGLISQLGEMGLADLLPGGALVPTGQVALNLSPLQIRRDLIEAVLRRWPPPACRPTAGARGHGSGAAAGHPEYACHAASCASSVCASSWTISARAIAR